jgi:hypothetical protein
MVLRNNEVIGEDLFQMLATVELGAGIFVWLLEDFTKRVAENIPIESRETRLRSMIRFAPTADVRCLRSVGRDGPTVGLKSRLKSPTSSQ